MESEKLEFNKETLEQKAYTLGKELNDEIIQNDAKEGNLVAVIERILERDDFKDVIKQFFKNFPYSEDIINTIINYEGSDGFTTAGRSIILTAYFNDNPKSVKLVTEALNAYCGLQGSDDMAYYIGSLAIWSKNQETLKKVLKTLNSKIVLETLEAYRGNKYIKDVINAIGKTALWTNDPDAIIEISKILLSLKGIDSVGEISKAIKAVAFGSQNPRTCIELAQFLKSYQQSNSNEIFKLTKIIKNLGYSEFAVDNEVVDEFVKTLNTYQGSKHSKYILNIAESILDISHDFNTEHTKRAARGLRNEHVLKTLDVYYGSREFQRIVDLFAIVYYLKNDEETIEHLAKTLIEYKGSEKITKVTDAIRITAYYINKDTFKKLTEIFIAYKDSEKSVKLADTIYYRDLYIRFYNHDPESIRKIIEKNYSEIKKIE